MDDVKKTPKDEDSQDLQKELDEKTMLAEERLNQLKYLQADFDNYRKNFDKEKETIIKLANENLVKDFLPLMDDFEKALESSPDKQGLSLLYKKFLKVLEAHGLRPIDSIGKKFDPFYHEALLKEKSDKEEGIVLEEIQKRFMLKTKVIRHSKVKVSENNLEESG